MAAKSTSSLCQHLQAAVRKLSHQHAAVAGCYQPVDSLALLWRWRPLGVHPTQYRLILVTA